MKQADGILELAALTDKYSDGDGLHSTAVPGLRCLKMSAPTQRLPTVYYPSICVIVQGSKQVLLENEVYRYEPSQFLAVSVDLPLLAQVTDASVARPYLCVQIEMDPRQMGELIAATGESAWRRADTTRGVFVGNIDEPTLDAVLRLTRLLESPKDIPLLGPMMLREVHYRVLSTEYGPQIAQMAIAGTNTHKIAHVIRRMKANVASPIRIDELASLVNMSPSSFYEHFKTVTAMSPLQYHKRLRLTEARQLLLSENVDAASAAFRVGYESASQFSREYARMFGAPPMRDIAGLRRAALS